MLLLTTSQSSYQLEDLKNRLNIFAFIFEREFPEEVCNVPALEGLDIDKLEDHGPINPDSYFAAWHAQKELADLIDGLI